MTCQRPAEREVLAKARACLRKSAPALFYGTAGLAFADSSVAAPAFDSVKYTTDQVTVRANWHLH